MLTFELPCFLMITICLLILSYRVRQGKTSGRRFSYWMIFSVYLAVVVSLTLFPLPVQRSLIDDVIREQHGEQHNFIPFKLLFDTVVSGQGKVFLIQIMGNVLLFVPLGIFVLVLYPRMKRRNVIMLGLLMSIGIESTQAITGLFIGYNYRSFDVDDLWLNVLGTMLGVLIISGVLKRIRSANQKNRNINDSRNVIDNSSS